MQTGSPRWRHTATHPLSPRVTLSVGLVVRSATVPATQEGPVTLTAQNPELPSSKVSGRGSGTDGRRDLPATALYPNSSGAGPTRGLILLISVNSHGA